MIKEILYTSILKRSDTYRVRVNQKIEDIDFTKTRINFKNNCNVKVSIPEDLSKFIKHISYEANIDHLKVLRKFPNLETVKIKWIGNKMTTSWIRSTRVKFPRVKQIFIEGFCVPGFEHELKKRLKSTCSINILRASKSDVKTFKQTLDSYFKKTLYNIVYTVSYFENFTLEFDRAGLTPKAKRFLWTVTKLDYTEDFHELAPYLKNLKTYTCVNINDCVSFEQAPECLSVKHLRMAHQKCSTCIENIPRIFPRLKTLKLCVENNEQKDHLRIINDLNSLENIHLEISNTNFIETLNINPNIKYCLIEMEYNLSAHMAQFFCSMYKNAVIECYEYDPVSHVCLGKKQYAYSGQPDLRRVKTYSDSEASD